MKNVKVKVFKPCHGYFIIPYTISLIRKQMYLLILLQCYRAYLLTPRLFHNRLFHKIPRNLPLVYIPRQTLFTNWYFLNGCLSFSLFLAIEVKIKIKEFRYSYILRRRTIVSWQIGAKHQNNKITKHNNSNKELASWRSELGISGVCKWENENKDDRRMKKKIGKENR